MAAQSVVFYYYHAIRAAVAAGGTFEAGSTIDNFDHSPLYDNRQGERVIWTNDLGTANQSCRGPVDGSSLSDAIDTIILSGHNCTGQTVTAKGRTSNDDLITPNHTITAADRAPVVVPLTAAINAADTHLQVTFISDGTGAGDAIVPELTELWLTTKHTMSKAIEAGWNHPWRAPALSGFLNQSGVSSTWLFGPARKTYRLTWDNLTGADLVILKNMRTQTDEFTAPFWMQPPDSVFPIVMVELDRDSDWEQVFEAPLNAGTQHRITLPLIEVIA